MSDDPRRLSLGWPAAAAAAVALLVAGALIGRMVQPSSAGPPADAVAAPASSAPAAPSPASEVAVTLTPEMTRRAGIELSPVGISTSMGSLRMPGVVEPNAYREVTATALADGRITRVLAELGQRVMKGQTLAEMYSPQLAELQTMFLGMRADLEAAHDRLTRTKRLVQIGAASRQELEQIRAEHARHEAALEGARARLLLLGVSREQLDKLSSADTTATVSVPAPIDGIVTKRDANAGMNVQAAAPLFTVVDLSTVWIVADLYEGHFSAVRVGNAVTIGADAYPGLVFNGRISYIDPHVQEATRTAKVRVEIANRNEQLRLGTFVNVSVDSPSGAGGVTVPRAAVQTIGDRHVVYLADRQHDGRFIEREVHLGGTSGDQISVLNGLAPGDRVVTAGAFFIRAERERATPLPNSPR